MTTKTNSNKKGNQKNITFFSGTGRRKEAVARVWLYEKAQSPVEGLVVNDKPITEYFADNPLAERFYRRPFEVTNTLNRFAASIKVSEGGKAAQLDAIVLGLARALEKYNPEFRPSLRRAGLLTRDPRVKERKKYFHRKARKSPQYSKR